jgi:TolB-like protein
VWIEGRLGRLGARRWVAPGLLLAVSLTVSGVSAGQAAKEQTSYFEFGSVVELGHGRVEVQTFDQQTRRFAQDSFLLSRDSRADLVRPGDTVEVIYTANGGDWTIRRLLVLHEGFPKAGPPAGQLSSNRPSPSVNNGAAAGSAVKSATLGRNPNAATLFGKPAPKPVAAVPVPAIVAPKVTKPVLLGVERDTPTAECRQSDPNWAKEPLSLAVLDFRYPTDREEAHDIGKTGGGSGTALADIIFERLKRLREFSVDRGDRRRLDRSDIAGAAKLGRELGVDAVLEGTFRPVDDPVKGYELRAGLVDTCTGQVLMKMTSERCSAGLNVAQANMPGPSDAAQIPACTRFSVSTKDASEPDAHAFAFDPAIGALIYPLEHNVSPGREGSAGVVTGTTRDLVIVRLAPGAGVKIGDQVAIHAARLAKNPVTYTLQDLTGQEIGRMTVHSLQGSMAVGSYAGDIFPKAGDAAELVTE